MSKTDLIIKTGQFYVKLAIQLSKIYWLLGSKLQLPIESELLLYKAILKSIWTWGVQLWSTAANSNMEIIQRYDLNVR